VTGLMRGDVHAQVTGAPAARAVGAVMLARVTAQPELEEAAWSLVASREVRGRDVTYWAGVERDWSPVDISDLEEIPDIPKYSPEEIRREFARYFPDDAATAEDVLPMLRGCRDSFWQETHSFGTLNRSHHPTRVPVRTFSTSF
jgi:hypothetical protein